MSVIAVLSLLFFIGCGGNDDGSLPADVRESLEAGAGVPDAPAYGGVAPHKLRATEDDPASTAGKRR